MVLASRKAFSSNPVSSAVAVVRACWSRWPDSDDPEDEEEEEEEEEEEKEDKSAMLSPRSLHASDWAEPRRLDPARTTLCTSSVTIASRWRQSGKACV